ncbi:hypothetical protein [Halovenus salina]|uniref:Uncharacterized protein n=1 Tax=Halovenus salina TaxID=1510225 RepID=A0ABD5W1J9_9EURY
MAVEETPNEAVAGAAVADKHTVGLDRLEVVTMLNKVWHCCQPSDSGEPVSGERGYPLGVLDKLLASRR